MSLVVLAVIIVGFYYFNVPQFKSAYFRWDNNEHAQLGFRAVIFLFIGFLFITIEASAYFSPLGQKSKAIMELMTPASITEKFLCAFFFTAVLSIVSYLLIFYVIDAIFVSYINDLWANKKVMNYNTGRLTLVSFSTIFDDLTAEREYKYLFALPFLVTSIFLLGSVYFNRFHYIKTAVSVTAFFVLVFFLSFRFANWITADKSAKYIVGGHDKSFVFTIFFWVTVAISLIIWLITYIRLKEKEV